MAYTPIAPTVTLPITVTVAGLPCQVGTLTIEPDDVPGSIRREVATFLREAADIYEQCPDEEVTDDAASE
ncbi:hypothetical protein [Streptomyces salyersiae]|uniref:Uncharacterized protein n=1 Tax=Streptomyces salyersiae TaxID=3075530 RepID=A0ABU2RW87_9ACTN|nr:hypothetical protein [Streptomyces sp. DSM 41770]MDT0432795.1 hypothetical protein [Streptomyces sp. DSM 41770]